MGDEGGYAVLQGNAVKGRRTEEIVGGIVERGFLKIWQTGFNGGTRFYENEKGPEQEQHKTSEAEWNRGMQLLIWRTPTSH